jgi:hypothetical protein
MSASFGLVYRDDRNVLAAIGLFAAMTVLLLWTGNVISISQSHWHLVASASSIVSSLLIGALFGCVVPMQIMAARMAAATATSTGGTVLGALAGTASLTCCAPVVLPSILSLAGFSGTEILNVNGVLHRFSLPLTTLSVVLLSLALVSVAQSLQLRCAVPSRRPADG